MDGKIKVSFGIKTSKQGSVQKKPPAVKNDVEYISSFDSTCKPMSANEACKTGELVIPSRGNQMKEQLSKIMKSTVAENGEGRKEGVAVPPQASSLSLEQLAAQELLKDAEGLALHDAKPVDAVPLPTDEDANGVEATLEDYENVPVEDFGKAMLRGMGWEPGKGIGKNQRIVAPMAPQLRPKGLGLGADRATPSTKSQQPSRSDNRHGTEQEDVPLTVGCGVQILKGTHGGLYGKVVSHSEDTGRCIVKLEISGRCESVNEGLVKVVGKEEYSRNCKIINAAKYKKYKETSDVRLQKMRNEMMEAEDRDRSSVRRQKHRSRSPHT